MMYKDTKNQRYTQIFKELLPIIQRIDWAEKSVTL